MSSRNGIDLVGWRQCAKQKELGPGRFVLTVSTLASHAALAPNLPSGSQSEQAAVSPERRRQLAQFRQVREGAQQFAAGTPECPKCALGGNKPFGCHRFVRRPIDAIAEKALFDYFTTHVDQPGDICESLYRDLISKHAAEGTPWHTDRGPDGEYAELPQPLEHKWGFILMRKRVDSAQILGSLFFTQKRLGLISAFRKFWDEFFAYARSTGVAVASSPVMMDLSGILEFYQNVEVASAQEEGVAVLVPEE